MEIDYLESVLEFTEKARSAEELRTIRLGTYRQRFPSLSKKPEHKGKAKQTITVRLYADLRVSRVSAGRKQQGKN